MLTLQWIDLTCPVCTTSFETIAVITGDSDSAETDDPAMGHTTAELLPYLVHVCRRCGYAGDVEAFGDDIRITPDVRARVWAELAPTLAPAVRMPWLLLTAPGSEKHEGAAKVAEWRAANALTIAKLWIRAARCAIDEGDLEAERYYARFAARWFAEALERNEVAPRKRANMVYALGQLWLRIGDGRKATGWFNRVTDEVVEDQVAQQSVAETARRQVGDSHDA
jgi:uncharacterized protein